MRPSKFSPEEITYELFGINPAEFYKDKFAYGPGLSNALAQPRLRYEISYEGVRRLIADLQKFLPHGGKVLDVGCGAGPYGPTLLSNVPGLLLYGVDMSKLCLEQSLQNGYAGCRLSTWAKILR